MRRAMNGERNDDQPEVEEEPTSSQRNEEMEAHSSQNEEESTMTPLNAFNGPDQLANPEEVQEAVGHNNQSEDAVAEGAGTTTDDEDQLHLEGKDMSQVLQYWDSKHTQIGFDPVIVLRRLAEIFEKETEIYMRKDPDPFDERHPYRTDPSCQFGFLLKQLFRKDHFMSKLVNDYLRENYFIRQNVQKSSLALNITALRLILVIMPGLETSAAFQVDFDHLIHRIYSWAEDSIEPLQSYATGLLAAAMEETVIAVAFREQNTRLVPKMIKRLHMLQAVYKNSVSVRGQACKTNLTYNSNCSMDVACETFPPANLEPTVVPSTSHQYNDYFGASTSKSSQNPSNMEEDDIVMNTSNVSVTEKNNLDAISNGLQANIYKRMYIPVYPLNSESSQMLILRYLTTMGEYQEFLGLFFEHNAIQLIFGYIENLNARDTCLAFEALKYLASLFCHKKFALEFISRGGLELLLKVPRPSIAATGVSITLYYLAYTEDAMERICTMPKPLITELVEYALWILGHSYDSGKCHATMFFGLSFQFKVILDEFDMQDGLRKLYNVISVLKILNSSNNEEESENNPVDEDVECASRQIVRHVCVALKRYMESHLFYRYNNFMRLQFPSSNEFNQNITKATKANLEQINEQIRTLQENTSVRNHWAPVDQLLKVGGITLLFKIIAFSYDWNNGGLSETVRSALDVLSICCVVPRVFPTFCDLLELPDNINSSGIYSILGAAAGDIVPDAEVQKAALAVLCNCVCSPIARKESSTLIRCFNNTSKRNKLMYKFGEELIEKIWASVCSNNGIIVLLSLVQIKTPITDADCIRGMACRALAGLVRSERVRQIVGKLPLFASGQIQALMRDPILQEKRVEHVTFQKYALELLEQVSGKTKSLGRKLDSSLANIHKANVIAQTKIQYNEQQLYQLIHDHLESKGLSQTAQMLQKEAGLPTPCTAPKSFHQSPFDYKVSPSTSMGRTRLRNRTQEISSMINGLNANATGNSGFSEASNSLSFNLEDNQSCFNNRDACSSVHQTPIKLVKKIDKATTSSAMVSGSSSLLSSNTAGTPAVHQQRSLQKQIYHVSDMNMADDLESPPTPAAGGITLNTIVTEYLTNQHALCNYPMTTCPQFDLLTPHKCPDPKPNRILGDNINITARLFRSQAGYNTQRTDRRYVHMNYAPVQMIRSNDYEEIEFTSCHIMDQNNLVVVGTHQGEAKVFAINDGTEMFSCRCHSFLIDSIQANRKGDLVITSSSWRSPLSVLWNISNNEFASKVQFNDEFYCEFSKQSEDKIIGTQNDCATIYDVETGQRIHTYTPTLGNQYTKNRATFCPSDELVLSDGVLWDVKSGKEIHKFDKLNQSLSGVFHPNGLEIISNTEVWDLRTFHLLQTIPTLDQCYIKFSPLHVLFGISMDLENRSEFDDTTTYDTSFKVLDAYDYTSITTIDVKRNIYDLCVNRDGSQIALVENQPSYDTKPETFVRIYAVGVKRHENEEEVRSLSQGCYINDPIAINLMANDNRNQGAAMGATRRHNALLGDRGIGGGGFGDVGADGIYNISGVGGGTFVSITQPQNSSDLLFFGRVMPDHHPSFHQPRNSHRRHINFQSPNSVSFENHHYHNSQQRLQQLQLLQQHHRYYQQQLREVQQHLARQEQTVAELFNSNSDVSNDVRQVVTHESLPLPQHNRGYLNANNLSLVRHGGRNLTAYQAGHGHPVPPQTSSGQADTTTTASTIAAAINALFEMNEEQEDILHGIGVSLNTLFCLQEEDEAPEDSDVDHSDSDSSSEIFSLPSADEDAGNNRGGNMRRQQFRNASFLEAAEMILQVSNSENEDMDFENSSSSSSGSNSSNGSSSSSTTNNDDGGDDNDSTDDTDNMLVENIESFRSNLSRRRRRRRRLHLS